MLRREHKGRAADGGERDPDAHQSGSGDPWATVSVRQLGVCPYSPRASEAVRVEAAVHLGRLVPADVRVDLEPEGRGVISGHGGWPIRMHSARSYGNGTFVFEARLPWPLSDGLDGVSVRVHPKHARGSSGATVSRSFPRSVLGWNAIVPGSPDTTASALPLTEPRRER